MLKTKIICTIGPASESPHRLRKVIASSWPTELVVNDVRQSEIHCRVVTGGILTSHKGLALPDHQDRCAHRKR